MSTGIDVFTVETREDELAGVDNRCCFQHGFSGDDHDSHVVFVAVTVLCKYVSCKLTVVEFMSNSVDVAFKQ